MSKHQGGAEDPDVPQPENEPGEASTSTQDFAKDEDSYEDYEADVPLADAEQPEMEPSIGLDQNSDQEQPDQHKESSSCVEPTAPKNSEKPEMSDRLTQANLQPGIESNAVEIEPSADNQDTHAVSEKPVGKAFKQSSQPKPGLARPERERQELDMQSVGNLTQPLMLRESPKFARTSNLTDDQPRIHRSGSLPERHHSPSIGILKKAKTESFMQRPKSLRFSTEIEVRDISPPRIPTPPPEAVPSTEAVVVGAPVDPSSIQYLGQLGDCLLALDTSAAAEETPAEPIPGQSATGQQMSQKSPSGLQKRGRMKSVSSLQLPNPLDFTYSESAHLQEASQSSQKPCVDEADQAESAASKTSPSASDSKRGTEAAMKTSAGDTLKQVSVQAGLTKSDASEPSPLATAVKQPVQHGTEAATSEQPCVDEADQAESAASKTSPSASDSKRGTEAAIKTSAGDTLKQVSVQAGLTKSDASEPSPSATGVKQPVQRGTEAATSEQPCVDEADQAESAASKTSPSPSDSKRGTEAAIKTSAGDTLKQVRVQAGLTKSDASEPSPLATGVKQPVQHGTEAATSEQPCVDEADQAESAASKPSPSASDSKRGTEAAIKTSAGDTLKQVSVQAGLTKSDASEPSPSATETGVKQPVQRGTEAATSEQPCVDEADQAESAASKTSPSPSDSKRGTEAAMKTSAGDTLKQVSVQAGLTKSDASEPSPLATGVKQPVQRGTEAATSEQPCVDEADQAESAASKTSPSASDSKRGTEAAIKTSAGDTLKQVSVQAGLTKSDASEPSPLATGVKQPVQHGTESATSEQPCVDEADQAESAASKTSPSASDSKRGTEAAIKTSAKASIHPGIPESDATETSPLASCGLEPLPMGSQATTAEKLSVGDVFKRASGPTVPGMAAQAANILQPTPKFGETADDQPRIHRSGSLPEPHRRPSIGILKKAKTESFLQTPKSLRFSTEIEVRDISPRSPCSPSPLAEAVPSTEAVVVGTPVDPSSIQWLQQLAHASRTASEDMPFGALPQNPGQPSGSEVSPESPSDSPKGFILQRGRSHSLSLLPDLPSPSHISTQQSSNAAEAAHPQAFNMQAPNPLKQSGVQHGQTRPDSKASASESEGFRHSAQLGAKAAPLGMPVLGDSSKQSSVQHGQAGPDASKTSASASGGFRHSAQLGAKAAPLETPVLGDSSKQSSVQHGQAGPDASKTSASASGGFRHSAQLGAKAAPLETPVLGDSSKQSSVQHGQAGPDASKTLASASGGFRHSAQLGAKAAPLETPVLGDSSKQSSVQHGQAGPDACKTSASASGGFRHSGQLGAKAKVQEAATLETPVSGDSSKQSSVQHGQAGPGASKTSASASGGFRHSVQLGAKAKVQEAATLEKPAFGNDSNVQHGQAGPDAFRRDISCSSCSYFWCFYRF